MEDRDSEDGNPPEYLFVVEDDIEIGGDRADIVDGGGGIRGESNKSPNPEEGDPNEDREDNRSALFDD